MRGRFLVIAALIAGTLAGCSSSDGSQDQDADGTSSGATSTTPSATVDPKLTAPKQRNQDGRPDVTYDPCLRIDDATIRSLGFDPATRARDDFVAEYTFLECKFKSNLRFLRIKSGNITMAEERQRYAGMIEDQDVNGREAFIVREPTSNDACALNMRTKEGYLRISTVLTVDALVQKIDRCDGILDMARTIEPTIGKGN